MNIGDSIIFGQRENTISSSRFLAGVVVLGSAVTPFFKNTEIWLFGLWLIADSLLFFWLNRRPLTPQQQQQVALYSLVLDFLSALAFLVASVLYLPGSGVLFFYLVIIEGAYRYGWRGALYTIPPSLAACGLLWFVALWRSNAKYLLSEVLVQLGALLVLGLGLAAISWQLNRNNNRYQHLLDSLLTLASSTSLDAKVLEEAAAQAALLLKADAASINLHDFATGASKIAAGYRLSPAYISQRKLRFPAGEPGSRFVFSDDMLALAGEQHDLMLAEGLRSGVGVRLTTAQGELLGMLSVYSRGPRKFSKLDATLLLPVADKLTGPLNFVRERLHLEQRVLGMEAIQQSAAAVVSDLDLPQVFNTILDAINVNLALEKAAVFLMDEQTGEGRIVSWRGLTDEYVTSINAAAYKPGHDSVAGAAILSGKLVSTPDVSSDDRYPLARQLAAIGGYRAMVAVPLLVEAVTIGALVVYGSQTHQFSPEDERLLTIFAGFAATAIKNARLYGQLQEQNKRLQQLDHLKSDFLARLSHELRSPLAVLLSYVEVLEDGSLGSLNERQQHFLRTIRNAGMEQLSTVEAMLNLAHLQADAAVFRPEPTTLCPFMQMVLDEVRPRAQKANISLSSESCTGDSPHAKYRVLIDPIMIRIALLNLLLNAVKFNKPGGNVALTVAQAAESGQVVVSVRDSGLGIASEHLAGIWDRFSQVEDAYRRKYGGLGLGLPTARQIIEKHGGRIWVESEPGVGSTFSFSLPLYTGSDVNDGPSLRPFVFAPLAQPTERVSR